LYFKNLRLFLSIFSSLETFLFLITATPEIYEKLGENLPKFLFFTMQWHVGNA
jgi:hypothetical protein